jgi:hypothetical protein
MALASLQSAWAMIQSFHCTPKSPQSSFGVWELMTVAAAAKGTGNVGAVQSLLGHGHNQVGLRIADWGGGGQYVAHPVHRAGEVPGPIFNSQNFLS